MLNNRKYAGGLAEEAAGYNRSAPTELRPRYIHTPAVTGGITVHTETAVHFDTAVEFSSEQNLKNLRFSEI